MEAKFFSEIAKGMDVGIIKDFEKELRKKIYNEFESLRKKNSNLSRILVANECEMWNKIKNGEYSWLKLEDDETKRVFRLVEIYSKLNDIVDIAIDLKTKVERIKQLKDLPVDSE